MCLLVNQEDVHFLGLQGVSSEQFVSHGFYDRGPGLISVSQAFLVPCASCIPIFANSIPVFIAPIHFFFHIFPGSISILPYSCCKKIPVLSFQPHFCLFPELWPRLGRTSGEQREKFGLLGPGMLQTHPQMQP